MILLRREKVRYKTLGRTGIKVSQMCLGTWGIGGQGWSEYSDEERLSAIQTAVEYGVNFIDTAPAYNSGQAERYVGNAVEKMNNRDKMIISTKCGNEFVDGKYYRCGSKKKIMKQCEESLRNLKTDYIDVYLVHFPDPEVEIEETVDAVETLKKEGKILHAGVSNFTQEQIERAEKCCDIEVFQPQYSLVDRKDEELIRWASEREIGIMSYGSLGGGILTGKYRHLEQFDPSDNRVRYYPYFKEPLFSQIMELLKDMDEIGKERNVPVSQIAMNWAAQKEFISSSIVGAQSAGKVIENCKSFDWELTQDEIDLLDKKSEILSAY